MRVALVAPTARSAIRMRGGLIREIAARGHKILLIVPAFTAAEEAELSRLGVSSLLTMPDPTAHRFFGLLKAGRALSDRLRDFGPQVLLVADLARTAFVAAAARRARIGRIVVLLTALPPELKGAVAGAAEVPLRGLGKALGQCHAIVFHNDEHRQRLAARGLLPAKVAVHVVPGAGVDLAHFAQQPLPPLSGGLVFLTLARLDRSKGVGDFLEAARRVKARAPDARFVLAGPDGAGEGAIAGSEIVSCADTVEFPGNVDDVRPLIAACHVFVYASHDEGMPRAVLEAMASGRPILTTRAAGCRDTVDERVNGCLVPPGDVAALADAMESFLKRPDLIAAQARASRLKAERRFDERAVVRRLAGILGLD